MQRSIALALAVAFAGCGSKDSEPAKQAPPPTEAPAPAPPAPTPPPAPAAGSDTEYDAHMHRGDELAKQRKWSESLAAFELAAAAKPNDARALASVGFAAYFAGKTARAKEASEAAVAAAGSDAKLKGQALFNLGLAMEEAAPRVAARLYAASNAIRPNGKVRARLAQLLTDDPYGIREKSPDGEALLAKLGVPPVKLPSLRKPPSKLDRALLAVFEAANTEWEGAAGTSYVMFENVACTEDTSATPHTYACTNPQLDTKLAKALVENLVARKVTGKKQGDRITYALQSVGCSSSNVAIDDDGRMPPAECEVTK